jgi:hypothetical protein
MRLLLLASCLGVCATAALAVQTGPAPVRLAAANANSCSGWKAICETRGPGCAAKHAACLKSGCWTEGKAHGGATHCGLVKR